MSNVRGEIEDIWTESFLDDHHVPTVKQLAHDLSAPGGVEQKTFRKVLEHVLTLLSSGTCALPTALHIAIQEDVAIGTLFAGVHCIFSSAVRHCVDLKVFVAHLKAMGIADSFVSDMQAAFSLKRDELLESANSRVVRLPSLSTFKWRVDVTISTTSMSRVFKPSILMQLELSDGRVHIFESNIERFHDLRYNVAKVLKTMNDMASNPILNRPL